MTAELSFKTDPKELAKDIQDSVNKIMNDSSDENAKRMLQNDCIILAANSDKNLPPWEDPANGGNGGPFRQSVREELQKLEDQGALPKVLLLNGSALNAYQELPGYHATVFGTIRPNAKVILANSDSVNVFVEK